MLKRGKKIQNENSSGLVMTYHRMRLSGKPNSSQDIVENPHRSIKLEELDKDLNRSINGLTVFGFREFGGSGECASLG